MTNRASSRLAVLAVVLVLASLPCGPTWAEADGSPDSTKAASLASAPVPDTATALEAGIVYLVQGQKLQKLETVPLDKDKSLGGLGMLVSAATLTDMTGEQFWGVLDGPKSDLAVIDAQPHFRVRAEKAKAMAIRLGRFAQAGKKRRARIDTNHPVDFFDGKYRVETAVTKLNDDLYDIAPAKPLKSGEYGLALTSSGPVADFHLDGKKK